MLRTGTTMGTTLGQTTDGISSNINTFCYSLVLKVSFFIKMRHLSVF